MSCAPLSGRPINLLLVGQFREIRIPSFGSHRKGFASHPHTNTLSHAHTHTIYKHTATILHTKIPSDLLLLFEPLLLMFSFFFARKVLPKYRRICIASRKHIAYWGRATFLFIRLCVILFHLHFLLLYPLSCCPFLLSMARAISKAEGVSLLCFGGHDDWEDAKKSHSAWQWQTFNCVSTTM